MPSAREAAAGADGLVRVIDRIEEGAKQSEERVSLEQVFESLGSRAYGPILLVPALIALIPLIGAIPGVSILTGTLLILVSAQILAARRQPWLPRRLLAIELPRDKLVAALDRTRRWARPVDRHVHPRHERLIRPPMLQAVAAMELLLGLVFYPTALIPYGVTLPALAATLLALALTTRDGTLVVVGLVLGIASLGVLVAFWPF